METWDFFLREARNLWKFLGRPETWSVLCREGMVLWAEQDRGGIQVGWVKGQERGAGRTEGDLIMGG